MRRENVGFSRVTIPNDAKVQVEAGIFRSDKFILEQHKIIGEDENMCLRLIRQSIFQLGKKYPRHTNS